MTIGFEQRCLAAAGAIAAGVLLSTAANAQGPAPPAPPAPPKLTENAGEGAKAQTDAAGEIKAVKGRPEGWAPGLLIGAMANLNDSRSVIGVQDGTSFTASYVLDGALDFNHLQHEWRNALLLSAGATRTPAIDAFVKTNDVFAFETIYLFHVVEIFGPFVRLALNTTMFPSYDVRGAPANYAIAELDGTTTNVTAERLALTDPFKPLLFKQSVGVFVQPLRETWMNLELRGGLGAQEGLAKGNLALADDSTTPNIIEIKSLDDFYLIGPEIVVNAKGFIDKAKRVSYVLGAGVLMPFVTSALPEGDDRTLPELTSVEGLAALNVKIFDWASFNYRLTVVRQPLLLDAWQISNTGLLTFAAAFGSKAPVPEPKCECPPVPPPPAPVAPAAPAPNPGQ